MKAKHEKGTYDIPKKPYKPLYYLPQIILFFVVLFAIAVVSFLLFLRPTYSESEKRTLAVFPSFSVEALLSGDYFADIDTWFSDTFPYREEMVQINGKIQSLYGIRKNIIYTDGGAQFDDDAIPDAPTRVTTTPTGTTTLVTLAPYQTTVSTTATTTTATTGSVTAPTTTTTSVPDTPPPSIAGTQTLGGILVANNAGYELYGFSERAANTYIKAINRAAAKFEGKANVYDILIPLAVDIVMDDELRADIHSADQKRAIDYIYGSLDPSVKVVDAYSILREHRDEYLYFRTDHHWTATGAYYAYAAFGAVKGTAVPALTDYPSRDYEGYLGSLYSKTGNSPALGNNPDTLRAYFPLYPTTMKFTDRSGNTTNWPVVKDVSSWKKSSLYSAFIGGDNPFSVIKNTALSDGSSCVVVKESFGNAFVPFLISHYETVYVVDYRYYNGDFCNFVLENEVDDVIFINNMSATRSSNLMAFIDDLIP